MIKKTYLRVSCIFDACQQLKNVLSFQNPVYYLETMFYPTFLFSEIKNVSEKSSCLGGDDLLGLQVIDGRVDVSAGDIIAGRNSGSFLGKVT